MHDEMSDYIMRLRDKIHRHIRYTNAIVDKFFFLNIQVFAFAYVIITSILDFILDFIFHFTIAFYVSKKSIRAVRNSFLDFSLKGIN